jgi:hypothetical protein
MATFSQLSQQDELRALRNVYRARVLRSNTMSTEKYEAPTPPRIPSSEEQFEEGASSLDAHVSSEDPHEGNLIHLGGNVIDCADDDCDDCPK